MFTEQIDQLEAYSSGRARFQTLTALLLIGWPLVVGLFYYAQADAAFFQSSAFHSQLMLAGFGWLMILVSRLLVDFNRAPFELGASTILLSLLLSFAGQVALQDGKADMVLPYAFLIFFLLPLLHTSHRYFYEAEGLILATWLGLVHLFYHPPFFLLVIQSTVIGFGLLVFLVHHVRSRRHELLMSQILNEATTEINTVNALASRDRMTGLYNRQAFLDRLKHLIMRYGHEESGLMFFFDMDKFKAINDTYGHEAGDKAIVAFATFLKGELRNRFDMAARFGGDEFYLVLAYVKPDITDSVVERLTAKMKELSINAGDTTIGLVASGGMVVINRSTDIKRALVQVDKLLYQSKKNTPGKIKTRFSLAELQSK